MGQFLSANEELLAVIQVGNTTVVLFLLFLLLYWHVLSLHLILPVKTLSRMLLSETTADVQTQPSFAP